MAENFPNNLDAPAGHWLTSSPCNRGSWAAPQQHPNLAGRQPCPRARGVSAPAEVPSALASPAASCQRCQV